ncbi:MAG: DUF2309 family protein [Bacteroidetes bacterium]|nr:DUF2309 family protein [Bacteroidota bacterium]
MEQHLAFEEEHTLHALRHYLPSQAPLKDFIHHNTLHAFQEQRFHKALHAASEIFGYSTYLPLPEYRRLYTAGRIREDVLDQVIERHFVQTVCEGGRRVASALRGDVLDQSLRNLKQRVLNEPYGAAREPRIGSFRRLWKDRYRVNLDKDMHPLLFRLLGNYLDQGIALWKFPNGQDEARGLSDQDGLLASVRKLEAGSLLSLFRGQRARRLLLETPCALRDLLTLLVGDEGAFTTYLFDQAFAHPGWSGMVAVLEERKGLAEPPTRPISLRDAIALELLLEIDALDAHLGDTWAPLATKTQLPLPNLFGPVSPSEYFEVLAIWQDAYEWSWFDQVLCGLQSPAPPSASPASALVAPAPPPALPASALVAPAPPPALPASASLASGSLAPAATTETAAPAIAHAVPAQSAQAAVPAHNEPFAAIVCIDDRSCSLRRYLEQFSPGTRTYGTPGFFNVEFFFQPEHALYPTKVCPAPVQPRYLIRESEAPNRLKHRKTQRDTHYSRHSQSLLGGWALGSTVGFAAAFRLAASIFRPGETPAMVSSFRHMDPQGRLSILAADPPEYANGLQVGFTIREQADRVEGQLRSIGLVRDFPRLVYVIGHGASSVNNTHYAGYDCGACSGRAGSVNARVFATMANDPEVRNVLAQRGILLSPETWFLAGLHDTTRDEIACYDEHLLAAPHAGLHRNNCAVFRKSLDWNARERSRRFAGTNTHRPAAAVHRDVTLRSVSLFEPRPEWNHATNALCIVGRRESNQHLFLDRRAFLNSYDYREDPNGDALLGILRAVAPVCGGINLEYYFSRVDNSRLGAGTKLSHNVMGLHGVANGMDGDLRTGLPLQMTNIHEPVRLLVVVEQDPELLVNVINRHPATAEWFRNEWVLLAAVRPSDHALFVWRHDRMVPYVPLTKALPVLEDPEALVRHENETLPVYTLQQ